VKNKFSIYEICLISLFAVLTSIGSWLIIPLPFSPVPVTLQTLFVFASGLLLGARNAAMSQIIYII
jgi:biotin transport system substrate-specific component